MTATSLELLAEFKRHTRLVTYLRPFETVEKIVCEPETAAILIDTYVVDERSREFRFKKHGQRLISFALCLDFQNVARFGDWIKTGEITIWDDEFVPFTQAKFGKSVTPEEYADRLAWERQCYRPGSDRTPLDSYSRVLSGPTTDAMERYW